MEARKGYGVQSKGSFLVTLKESNTHKNGPITNGAASRVPSAQWQQAHHAEGWLWYQWNNGTGVLVRSILVRNVELPHSWWPVTRGFCGAQIAADGNCKKPCR